MLCYDHLGWSFLQKNQALSGYTPSSGLSTTIAACRLTNKSLMGTLRLSGGDHWVSVAFTSGNRANIKPRP
jgi:hypothetical protein